MGRTGGLEYESAGRCTFICSVTGTARYSRHCQISDLLQRCGKETVCRGSAPLCEDFESEATCGPCFPYLVSVCTSDQPASQQIVIPTVSRRVTWQHGLASLCKCTTMLVDMKLVLKVGVTSAPNVWIEDQTRQTTEVTRRAARYGSQIGRGNEHILRDKALVCESCGHGNVRR